MKKVDLIQRINRSEILKSFDPLLHESLSILHEEYGYLDEEDLEKNYLKKEFRFDDEDVEDLYEGLSMERQEWGFKSKDNLITFLGKHKELNSRIYFIVTPDAKVFSTLELENLKNLKFGDPNSILKHNAAKYWGICKSLLDETVYERYGSF